MKGLRIQIFYFLKKFKENFDKKINLLEDKVVKLIGNYCIISLYKVVFFLVEEIGILFIKLGNCKIKVVVLSLILVYVDQFVVESRVVFVVIDLFNIENFDMNFLELLKLCLNVNLDIFDE